MTSSADHSRPAVLDAAAFSALYRRLRDASRWGPADRRGALNNITPQQVLAAVTEIRLGRTVTMASPLESQVTPDNPEPVIHQMTSPPGTRSTRPGSRSRRTGWP